MTMLSNTRVKLCLYHCLGQFFYETALLLLCYVLVAFRIYDIDQDGFISNGELFQVLKTMVGNNLTEKQLQEIVDKTILYADKDGDGKISYEEFSDVSAVLRWGRLEKVSNVCLVL